MKKQTLAIALVSVLGTLSGTAYAQLYPGVPAPPAPPAGQTGKPDLVRSEIGAYCLLESAASVVAANVAHFTFCSDAVGTYKVSITADETGAGLVKIDANANGAGGVQLSTNAVTVSTGKGYKCSVRQQGSGFLKATDTLVSGYSGDHAWSSNRKLFLDYAPTVNIDGIQFDEHSIKDFYRPTTGCTGPSNRCPNAVDYGYELITKAGFPRQKWWEQSTYYRENGGDGRLVIKKTRVEPSGCTLTLDISGGNNGGFDYAGTIVVQ